MIDGDLADVDRSGVTLSFKSEPSVSSFVDGAPISQRVHVLTKLQPLLRKWCMFEYFTPEMDKELLERSDFKAALQELGLGNLERYPSILFSFLVDSDVIPSC